MKITLLTGKTYNIAQAFDFELRVVKNPRAKKLTLRIDSKERVPVLSIPRYCSQKRAIQFVEEHRLWIKEALSRIPEHKLFENGETIPLFGKEVTIVHAPERRLGAKLEGNTLLVSGEAEFLHRRVKDFIKKKAQSEFLRRSKKYAKKLMPKLLKSDTKSRKNSKRPHSELMKVRKKICRLPSNMKNSILHAS